MLENDIAFGAVKRHNDRVENCVLNLDWDTYDILDIVTTYTSVPGTPELEFHTYSGVAPPLSTYADNEHRYEVQRLTRPQLIWFVERGDLPPRYHPDQ